MKNLFKADVVRILKTKMIYLGIILASMNLVSVVTEKLIQDGYNAANFILGIHSAMSAKILFPAFMVIPIYLSVFGNELTSKSMQVVIGHGIGRGELIVTKLIEAAVFMAVYFLVIFGIIHMVSADENLFMSEVQSQNLVIYLILMVVRYYGYIVFSAMLLFLSDSTTIGTIACVFFSVVYPIVAKGFLLFSDIDINSFTYDGLLAGAYTGIETGGFGWQIFPAVLYLVGAVAVTIILFQRKEFEF